MNFTEIRFILFFGLFLLIFALAKNPRNKVIALLILSYVFYSIWNVKYLPLLMMATLVDFTCAKIISKNGPNKKYFLFLSLGFNLCLLFIFKYFNFFVSPFIENHHISNLIIPVGLSFYTFQSMSYTIDVFNNPENVETDIFNYALFVSFFPQLIAGPIERASHLLPLLKNLRNINEDDLKIGLHLILIGFFKKMVLADNLGEVVDHFYANPHSYSSLDSIVALYLYAFQIYFDFSSYTDIARGVARTMGVNLVENFNLPYLAISLNEFWRKWHMSLTNWFKDYVFFPLCFNSFLRINILLATIIVFLLSGLWHGANWTFVVWGGMNGLILIIESFYLNKLEKVAENKILKYLLIILNFHIVCFLWVFFRSSSIHEAIDIFKKILFFKSGNLLILSINSLYLAIFIILSELITYKWINNNKFILELSFLKRWSFYIAILFLIGLLGHFQNRPYIYFQF